MTNERTIKVTGRSEMRVKPDTANLSILVERTEPGYADALEAAERAAGKIRELLVKAGVPQAQIGMRGFRTATRYEEAAGQPRVRRPVGYTAVWNLHAAFGADPALLRSVLAQLAEHNESAEISVAYALKDEKALRKELLARAVRDARSRAEIIADAAGVSLGEAVSIEHGGHAAPLMQAAYRADGAADLTPEEIALTETVAAVFAIG